MKKIMTLSALLILASSVATARVTHIADWNGELPGEETQPATSCAQQCEGYDLTTLICPEGEKLIDCPVDGCNYYHQCVEE